MHISGVRGRIPGREYKLQTCWVGSTLGVEQKIGRVFEGSCPRGRIIRDKAKEVEMQIGSLGPSNHWKHFRFFTLVETGKHWKVFRQAVA